MKNSQKKTNPQSAPSHLCLPQGASRGKSPVPRELRPRRPRCWWPATVPVFPVEYIQNYNKKFIYFLIRKIQNN